MQFLKFVVMLIEVKKVTPSGKFNAYSSYDILSLMRCHLAKLYLRCFAGGSSLLPCWIITILKIIVNHLI